MSKVLENLDHFRLRASAVCNKSSVEKKIITLSFQLQVCFDDSGLAGRSSASLERLLHRTALLVGCPRVLPPQDLQTQDRARGEVLDLSGRGYTASATILGLGC